MRRGNDVGRVCLSQCLSVCPVRGLLTFESLDLETLFLVTDYIFIISRSGTYIKVIGSRSRSQDVPAGSNF